MVTIGRKSLLRSRRGRSSERGATLFVVVLVMTLLLGIGAFAARSAHLATASSGYSRQQTQARYVGEYALMLATTLLSGGGGQSYLRMVGNPPASDLCDGQTATAMSQRTCYKMFYQDLQTMVGAQGFSLCQPGAATFPGSLGMANAECNFKLELTDKMLGMTPSGFDTGPGKPLKFFYVTATVIGQVRLIPANAATLDAASAQSTSMQTLRSRILAGPYPAN